MPSNSIFDLSFSLHDPNKKQEGSEMSHKTIWNKYPREYFETPESRRKHLGGGCTHWRNLGRRYHLGYREGIRTSSWYARFGWAKNKKFSIRFAEPDDLVPCDGVVVLSFEQALNKAAEICRKMEENPTVYRVARGKYAELPTLPPTPPYKVVHALMDYRDRQISLGKRVRPDESHMRNSIIPHLGHINVEALTTKNIRDWLDIVLRTPPRLTSPRQTDVNYLRATNDDDFHDRRRGAANVGLRILRAALQLAFENGHCETDAAWKRIKNFRRHPPKPPRYLERDEIHRLVDVCPPDLRRLVVAALLTGCRANELQKLKVGDYRVALRRIIVTDDKTRKTRHVSLSHEGKEFFDRLSGNRPADELMLVRADGTPWNRNGHLYRLHRACNSVGISPVVGLHDLRRTFASHAIMGGVPIHVVSKQLGHAKLETTERSYMHLSMTYMDDIFFEKMPTLITGEKPWHLYLD